MAQKEQGDRGPLSVTAESRIYLLGDFRLTYDGEPVTAVNTARMQALLAYLLLHRDAPQSRQRLAFLFWPDSTERQARTNLRNLLHLLRRALPDADGFLQVNGRTVGWLPDTPVTSDVGAFEDALAEVDRAGKPAAERGALERAVALYQGELLPSCYDDWVLPERERLGQAFIGALERLVGLLEEARDYRAAIEQAQRLLRHDPLHEATYRRLMRLHALNGDRAGALRVYHTCATVLERELGVAPGPATREAYEGLISAQAPLSPPAQAIVGSTPLVGRESEWSELQVAWRNTAQGKPHLALISGEAGIGKTRLAEELLGWAARQGIPTASARCYASSARLAFAPVTAWLRTDRLRDSVPSLEPVWLTEIARLLPELLADMPDIPTPNPLGEAWQRQRLFEALSRPFFEQRQLVLMLDDLQWCDHETLEWLAYLLQPTDRPTRLLVVAALRVEEMSDDERLPLLLRDLRRGDQLTEVELGPLTQEQVVTLAANLDDEQLNETLAEELYRETEGNALFVVETVRAGLAAPGGESGPAQSHWALPPSVQEAIARRLARLSPEAQDLAGLAATIGREFTFGVLALASGGDEEGTVQGMDELWQRRIVRELGADAYDFSHDKIREVAYARLSAARRRLLHRRVAEALESVYAGELDGMSGQIASHYERAGHQEAALAYNRRAAAGAERVYAHQEAIQYYRKALNLVETAPTRAMPEDEVSTMAAQICEEMGDVQALIGRHHDARQAYGDSRQLVPERDRLWQARLVRKTGNTWQTQRNLEKARQAYEMAETTLGQATIESDLEWWQEWLVIQLEQLSVFYLGDSASQMDELAQRVRPIAEQFGTHDQHARLLHTINMADNLRERFVPSEATIKNARAALALRQESGDPSAVAFGHFSLGFNLLWSGALDEAKEHLLTALEFGEKAHYAWLTLRFTGSVARCQRQNSTRNVA